DGLGLRSPRALDVRGCSRLPSRARSATFLTRGAGVSRVRQRTPVRVRGAATPHDSEPVMSEQAVASAPRHRSVALERCARILLISPRITSKRNARLPL